MAASVLYFVSLCSVLCVARTDDRVFLTAEGERLWNTPPILVSEREAFKSSDIKNERSLSIPITTNINVNSGSSAHSAGFHLGPESISYSESNSFSHSGLPINGAASQSHSMAFTAGLTGIVDALSEAVNQFYPVQNNRPSPNRPSINIATVSASSSANVHNGQVSTSATSSSASSSSSSGSGIIHIKPQTTMTSTTIRFPTQNQNRPGWTNIRPNHNNNGWHPSRKPKLEIEVKPQEEHTRGPITIHVSTQRPRWENSRQPTIRISKWQPGYRGLYTDDDEK